MKFSRRMFRLSRPVPGHYRLSREAREHRSIPVDRSRSSFRLRPVGRPIRSRGLSPKGCALRLASRSSSRMSEGRTAASLSAALLANRRRLYDQYRQRGHACLERCGLFAVVRSAESSSEAISRLTDAPAFIDTKLSLPAKDLKDLIVWLKANPNKASAGVFATWSRLLWRLFPEQHRYAHSIRAVSRGGARDAGSSRRADRSHVRSGGEYACAIAQ